jgi:hypothetical protein
LRADVSVGWAPPTIYETVRRAAVPDSYGGGQCPPYELFAHAVRFALQRQLRMRVRRLAILFDPSGVEILSKPMTGGGPGETAMTARLRNSGNDDRREVLQWPRPTEINELRRQAGSII